MKIFRDEDISNLKDKNKLTAFVEEIDSIIKLLISPDNVQKINVNEIKNFSDTVVKKERNNQVEGDIKISFTVLHSAIIDGNLSIVKNLLEYDADPNIEYKIEIRWQPSTGRSIPLETKNLSPVELACSINNLAITKELITYGGINNKLGSIYNTLFAEFSRDIKEKKLEIEKLNRDKLASDTLVKKPSKDYYQESYIKEYNKRFHEERFLKLLPKVQAVIRGYLARKKIENEAYKLIQNLLDQKKKKLDEIDRIWQAVKSRLCLSILKVIKSIIESESKIEESSGKKINIEQVKSIASKKRKLASIKNEVEVKVSKLFKKGRFVEAEELIKNFRLKTPIEIEKEFEKINTNKATNQEKIFYLLLGEANFSFALSLANKLNANSNKEFHIVATEKKPFNELKNLYKDAFTNSQSLLKNNPNVTLLECIDATKINEDNKLAMISKRFKRIFFNCPHDGKSYKAMDFSTPDIVSSFFKAARNLQKPGDRIHMILPKESEEDKKKWRYSRVYDILNNSANNGYRYYIKIGNIAQRYPGYTHTMTNSSAPAIPLYQLREHIFTRTDYDAKSLKWQIPPDSHKGRDCLPEIPSQPQGPDSPLKNNASLKQKQSLT